MLTIHTNFPILVKISAALSKYSTMCCFLNKCQNITTDMKRNEKLSLLFKMSFYSAKIAIKWNQACLIVKFTNAMRRYLSF